MEIYVMGGNVGEVEVFRQCVYHVIKVCFGEFSSIKYKKKYHGNGVQCIRKVSFLEGA